MRKKIGQRWSLFLVTVLCLSLLLPGATVWAEDATFPALQGEFLADINAPDGSAIAINTAGDLAKIGVETSHPLNGSYVLTANITLSGAWTPLGSETYPFTGTFDGQGKTISGLTITSADQYSGLFGYIKDATIKNVGLVGTSINVANTYPGYAGSIVGYSEGTSNISNCYNTGSVRSTSNYWVIVGGLIGSAEGITISDSYNTGSFGGGDSITAGGIIGEVAASGIFTNCHNAGTTTIPTRDHICIGGIVGNNLGEADISNCSNRGNLTTQNAGDSDPGESDVGGIIGYSMGEVSLSACYNTGDISSFANYDGSWVGGIIGGSSDTDCSIEYCFNTGAITATGSSTQAEVGGILGHMSHYASVNVSISDCYNTGDVRGTSDFETNVGGILGWNTNPGSTSVSNCYNTGAVSSTVTNSASDLKFSRAGGIVGGNFDYYDYPPNFGYDPTDISNISVNANVALAGSVNAVSVDTAKQFSRTVGPKAATHVTASDNLAVSGMSGNATNDASARVSLAEAREQSTYTNLGWDFNNVWEMRVGYDYPQLRGLPYVQAPPSTIKNITVGTQSGVLTVGTAGSATFTVTTENIVNGTYPATLTGAPSGATAANVTVAGGNGTLTINTTASTPVGTHSLTLTLNGATSVSFNLVVSPKPTYALAASTTAGGALSGTANGNYLEGKAVSLTATPSSGYHFVNWTASGLTLTEATANPLSFNMPASAVTLTANFDLDTPTVTNVAVSPTAIEVQQSGSQQFAATVLGTNNPAQDVTWVVTGGIVGTSIANNGLLTIAAGETAETLTVTATSNIANTVFGTATVTVTSTAPASVYAIAFSTGDHVFPAALLGYGAQPDLTVTVTNTGNEATGALTVALSGTNPSAFALSATTISDISSGTVDTFTVAPVTGLTAGTYAATVTVSGANDISAQFAVSFSVNTGVPASSSDANLSGLSLSIGALNPTFNPSTTGYTATVANNVSSVVITAVTNAGATVAGTGAQSIVVGANTFAIIVTAEDGITTKTYNITITRQSSSNSGNNSNNSGSNGGSGGGGSTTPPIVPPTTPRSVSKADLSYISGTTRVDTAVAISRQGWPNGAETVFLAPALNQNLIDSLGLAPLAAQLNAPTLLNMGTVLEPSVIEEIKRLGTKNIMLTGAVSSEIAAQLRAAIPGLNVEVLSGATRFETLALLNARITEPKGVFLIGYDAIADAVSIASWAAAHSYVIQLASPDGSWQNPSEYANLPGYIIGGPTLVKDTSSFPRLAGADRYATNAIIRSTLTFSTDIVYTANGSTLVDALAGAVLASRSNAAIVLAPGGDPAGVDFGAITAETKVYAFGGSR